MALSNRERVGRAFDLLSEGLQDIVDEVMSQVFNTMQWDQAWARLDANKRGQAPRSISKVDVQVQLRAITEYGREFSNLLSRPQQSYASELREYRNLWAHSASFSAEEALRALDTIERLLKAVDSPDSANDVRKIRQDLLRQSYEEHTKQQVKSTAKTINVPGQGLKAWREVITPHEDVAKGAFTASEFAADLHLVHTGEITSAEYANPVEFFSRTYLTEGLSDLLTRALKRLSGDENASPVVNLQTNFGGGKTHSMLALYHLFSGLSNQAFPQEIQTLIHSTANANLTKLKVKRVALVGTYIQAGSPAVKEDGTEVSTLWGELAWQLGGREGYEMVADADQTGTSPGAALRKLIERYSPALILIDEWVAYARQLVTDKHLPAGPFETQFTFAQALTEAVKSVPGAMVVVSIPASGHADDGHGADIEVGGANGQLALERLQNVIRRVADQWRPSTKDESFEIVRRRLFQTPDAEGLQAIAAVARSFTDMYRQNRDLFPRDAANPNDDYEQRIRASYPLHPELLDRLYEDWSALERFQRTRGVLRLVSWIVHELWQANDGSPLIMPGNVPLDKASVNADLTQYLEDSWKPIIDTDIDGPDSTAFMIDKEKTNLGGRSVTRRLSRAIFMGAAPRSKSANKGVDKQYVWLGTAIPGDVLGDFSPAIELVSQRATYFYHEQGHFWFDTQPSVTKTASDYAERLREDRETVLNEIINRIRGEERARSVFDRVHIAPDENGDIPDLEHTRLVIVHPRYAHHKSDGAGSEALAWVRKAIEYKGATQRRHRNALIFLLADRGKLERLENATRQYLGWKMVHDTADALNLTAQQLKQTKASVQQSDQNVTDRLQDTFSWAAYPQQFETDKPFDVATERLGDGGGKKLAERVASKLQRSDELVTEFGPPILGITLHQELGKLWAERGELTVAELWQYFTQFIYMPRLANRDVLDECLSQSLHATLVGDERFALADGKDDTTNRYIGLIDLPNANAVLQVTDSTLVVDADRADRQLIEDCKTHVTLDGNVPPASAPSIAEVRSSAAPVFAEPDDTKTAAPTRFFGSVQLDSERFAKDFANIARDILAHLQTAGAELTITVEMQAVKPEGFNAAEKRTVSENAQALKFLQHGFE